MASNILVMVLCVATALGWGVMREYKRQRRVAGRTLVRRGLTKNEFVAHFERLGVPENVSGAVYDEFGEEIPKGATVDPQDSLHLFYEFDGDRYEEHLDEVLKTIGLASKDLHYVKALGKRAVDPTVGDLVIWLADSWHESLRRRRKELC